MGFVNRKISGDKKFNGSKLNVPGQGISTTKISPPDKVPFKNNNTNSTTNNNTSNQVELFKTIEIYLKFLYGK